MRRVLAWCVWGLLLVVELVALVSTVWLASLLPVSRVPAAVDFLALFLTLAASAVISVGLLVTVFGAKEITQWVSRHLLRESSTSQNPNQSLSRSDKLLLARTLSQQSASQVNSQFHAAAQSRDSLPCVARETPVVGFRAWRTVQEDGFTIGVGLEERRWLASLHHPGFGAVWPWEVGVNTATCGLGKHVAPMSDCGCGLYVQNSIDKVPVRLPAEPDRVVGAVVGWGKVIEHGDEGWRAEHAQIIALLDCKLSDEHLELTRRVAEAYGVPVLERPALELLAKEYGDPGGTA